MDANRPMDLSDVGSSRFDSCTQRAVCRFQDGKLSVRLDSVIQEVFYQLVADGVPTRTITCSPWNVRELAVGVLFTGGVIDCRENIAHLEIDEARGVIEVALAGCAQGSSACVAASEGGALGAPKNLVPERRGAGAQGGSPAAAPSVAGAAVGVPTATAATGAVAAAVPSARFVFVKSPLVLAPELILERIALLENGSELFHRTGGVHTAALAGENGIEAWFEDVGRHNALDKLAGWCVLNGVDASRKTLLFSGRVPHEIIVKVAQLGCPMIISPGAPTSYSVEYAQRHGVTLIGFAKNGHFNAYSHAERIGNPAQCTLAPSV